MSDKIGEQLSAFMDGETHKTEHELLVRRLEVDPDLKGCWERYHVIRDVLQRQYHPELPAAFADRVMAALESEPARVRQPNRTMARLGGPLSGLALAATVAGVAILGARYYAASEVENPTLAQGTLAQGDPPTVPVVALEPSVEAPPRPDVSGPDLLLVVDHKLILRDPGLNRYPWVGVDTPYIGNE
jgi:negative regulator of sigma E activity